MDEWLKHARAEDFPRDIPSRPDHRYAEWAGWGDWLGFESRWNRLATKAFLADLCPVVDELRPAELFAILNRRGVLSLDLRHNENRSVFEALERLWDQPDFREAFAEFTAGFPPRTGGADHGSSDSSGLPEADEADLERSTAPQGRLTLKRLKAPDVIADARLVVDEDVLDYLVENRVSELWQAYLDGDPIAEPSRLRAESGGERFRRIRDRFLEEYEGALGLPIPAGYDFRDHRGRPQAPTPMQRLTAYRLLKEGRLGNWSGVGAGKTVSAVLASRVVGARLTLVIAANATVESWARVIRDVYPDSSVHVRARAGIDVDPGQHTYLIVNYESFQQKDSAAFVADLTTRHRIDLVVLDEIQSVKQRWDVESERRRMVRGLLDLAAGANPGLRVLGMSATPVLSSLDEARSLLQLVTALELAELDTRPTIQNALAVNQKLLRHGIRYRPNHRQALDEHFPRVDGTPLLGELRRVPRGLRSVYPLEKLCFRAKLPGIVGLARRGTMIFSLYVEEIVGPLARALRDHGLSVGIYTGDDKSGLEPFLARRLDVLIGSAPIGTGVDGLQHVCDRLIFASLPWTSAEYEQVVGRLLRKGSDFDRVEVVIPQVVLGHGQDEWSWDRRRWQRVQFKRTLADAAVDGVVPDRQLPSPERMHEQSLLALQAWIDRLDSASPAEAPRVVSESASEGPSMA